MKMCKNIIKFLFMLVVLVKYNLMYLGCRLNIKLPHIDNINKYTIVVNDNNITEVRGTTSFWSGECNSCKPKNNNVYIKTKNNNGSIRVIETNDYNVECKIKPRNLKIGE